VQLIDGERKMRKMTEVANVHELLKDIRSYIDYLNKREEIDRRLKHYDEIVVYFSDEQLKELLDDD
jgi:hypothetical protein